MSEKEPREKGETAEQTESAKERQPTTSGQSAVSSVNPAIAKTLTPEEQRRAQDRAYQHVQIRLAKRQIRTAKKLNCITAWAGGVAATGIVILFATFVVTKEAADTAGQAANAAKDSADAELASVRAWLVPYDVKFPPIDKLSKDAPIDLEVQNNGKTVALDPLISDTFVFWNGKQPMPRFNDCPSQATQFASKNSTIGIERPSPLWDPFKLTLDGGQKAELAARTAAIVIHACAWYGLVPPQKDKWGLTDYCSIAYLANPVMTYVCSNRRAQLK